MDVRRLVRVGVCVGALMSPAIASAIQKPRPEDRVLPDFDIRNESGPLPVASDETRKAVSQLRAQFPGLRARFHPLTGTLRQLSAAGGPLTPPTGDSPNRAAVRFLAAHRAAFGLGSDDLPDLAQVEEIAGSNQPLIHLVFHQIVNGIRVFGADVRVHMTRARSILAISSSTVHAHGRSAVPQVGAAQAVQLAALDIRSELGVTPSRRMGPIGNDRFSMFGAGPFKRDVQARLVFFPIAGSVRLAWRVEIEPNGFPQAYEILVDAATGEILYRRNLYQYVDGVARVMQSDATQALDRRRPDEHPAGTTPGGSADGCPPAGNFLVRGLTQPFRDSASVLFAGLLAGNNSQTFRRTTGVEGVRGVADDTGAWAFDFPFNTASSAETQAFFALNFLHDFFYDLGFDEAAGNFQMENFGQGGIGGDSVNANVRAVGRNNANFATPPDGQKPTLNLFLWDGTGCWSADADGDGTSDLDSAYDSDIIIHEFHHGVSNRLNPTFTGSEASAMGEGGGDFFAYSINGDTKLAEYAAPPDGIRQVNGKTYADWLCLFFLFCEPHDNGEIWANTLWDVRERFRLDRAGGSEEVAIEEVHQLYVDGLKLSPPGPTMLDLRDAMLLADVVRSPTSDPGGSENYCRLWTAFAGRGMGTDAQDTKDTGDNSVVADFTLPGICTGGSVLPTVVVTAGEPTATEAGPSAGAFRFTRAGGSQTDLIVRYTVAGTAAAGADYTALSGTITIPAGSDETALAVAPLDDTSVEADESVTVILSGGAGYLVGTPNRATVTIVSDDVVPDLVVSALSAPPIAGAGGTIAVSDTTLNQGQGAADPSATRFYLSKNLIIDAGDALLGSRAVPGLAPGASSGGSTALTIPGGTAPGQYFLLAQADGDLSLTESLETNNVRLSSMQIGSDLVVSALGAPLSVGPGSSIALTDTTKNQGADAAPPTITRFYLSTNVVLDSGDSLLGQRSVTALGGGTSNTATTTVSVPDELATGQYYIIALADALNSVTETQEANNTKFAAVQIGGDLVISSLTGPSTAAPGGSIAVNDSTKNQGSGTVQDSVTLFSLSANALLDAFDVAIGSRVVPTLAAGAVSAASTALTIPAGTATGVYYVIAAADSGGAVTETQEANNTRLIAVSIGPDLAVAGLSAATSVQAGGSLTIGDMVRNQGQGLAGASTTRFYLSANLTLDATDEWLGSRDVPPVATGGLNAGSTAVTIPSTTPPGTRYIIVKVDADGAVAETQETNNVTFRPIQVTTAP